MSDDASIESVRASMAMAMEELGRGQAMLAAANDRVDAVRAICRRVTQGSGKNEVSVLLAGLADMTAGIEQALTASLIVKEQAETFTATL